MSILLDTNVVSELMRPVSSPAVLKWMSKQPALHLYTSSITVAEILYGIEVLPQGHRRRELLEGAERMLTQVFAGRILVFDEPAARSFSQIAAVRRRHGRPIAEMDAQIAAIASVHDALLATRNTSDFEDCGVRLINPWE
jgi:toxin FitB